MSNTNDVIVISPDEASARGLQPVSIRIDARSAGLSGRKFPGSDVFLKLNGPPGAPLILMVWDCRGCDGNVEATVRARLVPAWVQSIEAVAADAAHLFGRDTSGISFVTGSGAARTAWFACMVVRGDYALLLTIGVGGRDMVQVPAAEVLSNSAIKRALETLVIEP